MKGDWVSPLGLSPGDLKGQGTFSMKDTEQDRGTMIFLDIMEASEVVLNVAAGGVGLDIFHVNGEGCEYEMLENVIRVNLNTKIRSNIFRV